MRQINTVFNDGIVYFIYFFFVRYILLINYQRMVKQVKTIRSAKVFKYALNDIWLYSKTIFFYNIIYLFTCVQSTEKYLNSFKLYHLLLLFILSKS